MALQTNYPFIKAEQGISIDVVEEWLRENKKPVDTLEDQQKDISAKTSFNNVSTEYIKERAAKKKQVLLESIMSGMKASQK